VARILLVQNDPLLCQAVSDYHKSCAADELECALTGSSAEHLLAAGGFEVAAISAILPDRSGIELAALAVNENIPVLMLSANSLVSRELERLHYQYLQHPFTLEALLCETKRVMHEAREHFSRVNASFSKMDASLAALQAEMAESHRLFDAIVARLGYWRR
jgi:DNA-binding response OmpR family regulator